MNPSTESDSGAPRKKPRLALLLATAFGLGNLPKAPGTWGSLAGTAIYWGLLRLVRRSALYLHDTYFVVDAAFPLGVVLTMTIAIVGVWAASRAADYWGIKDPGRVVIDEVSGQHLSLLIGLGWSVAPNWKYLLAGFILFRVFDIWKPFPVRQVEALPGGWGIMADDWVAAIYAALGLWVARAFGL
ncbi:MAG: phosphatidylglycerophosphatase A [Acidobacteria bacterium]|nr:phosphatidylglycerophosphatase A [Acidobacteriota bacterium]